MLEELSDGHDRRELFDFVQNYREFGLELFLINAPASLGFFAVTSALLLSDGSIMDADTGRIDEDSERGRLNMS
jgi:hypothetical protein